MLQIDDKLQNVCDLGMGCTYAKFIFSTADFQVKFDAGRFCAKIFLSSLQSHWLLRILMQTVPCQSQQI